MFSLSLSSGGMKSARMPVARRAQFAPPSVLRQANAPGHTVAGDVRSGTIMVYQLEKIRPKNPDAVFMTGTWAECPALLFVPALYAAVWNGACVAEKTEKRT